MNERKLNKLRLKILKLLMEDTIIRKKHFKIEKVEVNGKIESQRVFSDYRGINCKVDDWKKADIIYRGNSARERVRLLAQEIRKVAKEIRKLTFEMDKEAKEGKVNND